jgi:hypothetical protein
MLVLLMSLTTSCFDIFSSATVSRPFAMFSKSLLTSETSAPLETTSRDKAGARTLFVYERSLTDKPKGAW